jgi:creatinine amidohydrolase
MLQLYGPRDYVVYLVQPHTLLFGGKLEAPWDPSTDGHAGPGETSLILSIRPDLVNLERVPAGDEGKARGRLQTLREAGVQTGVWWYADFPTHYQGDASSATADTGERFFDAMAEVLAKQVRLIKEDTTTQKLQDEFYSRQDKPSS